MSQRVSKSQFKPRSLEFLRQIEQSREELIITDRGRPVVKIVPYSEDADERLASLRGSVMRYEDPTEPVDVDAWEALR